MNTEDLLHSLLYPFEGSWAPAVSMLLIIVIFAAVAFAFVSLIYVYYKRHPSDKWEWTMTADTMGNVITQIQHHLADLKASKREIVNAALLLEETAVRLMSGGIENVTVRMNRFLGEINMSITSVGEEFNPFASLSEWNTESEDYYRDMIFRAHQSELSYSRRGGRNIVMIRVHSTDSKAAFITAASMIAGIIFGFAMKLFPESVSSFINASILSVVQSLFMNALQMFIAPVVFFSLTTSIASLSGGKEVGRIGSRTVSMFFSSSIVSLFIGTGLAYMFFSGNLPDMTSVMADVTKVVSDSVGFSVIDMIIDIIPKNLVSPISANNMIQIIFISVLVGLALCALGDKVASLKQIFSEANTLFVRLVAMIIKCMPIVVFSAMASLISQSNAETIGVLMKFLAAICLGSVCLAVMNCLLVAIFGRVSPLSYISKALQYLPTVFMISSSSACIPMTLNMVRKKLGVSDKVSAFVVPVGATVNMNGSCLQTMLTIILLMKIFSVPVTASLLIRLMLITFLLSVGSPGVPNSSLVVLTLLLSIIGLPTSALGLVIGIWNIVDRVATVNNVNGDIATSVIVSAAEKDLDIETYHAKNLRSVEQ